MDTFDCIDTEGWNKTVAANSDPYGSAGVSYAARWAALMDQWLAEGRGPLERIAETASHEADTEGITGFMYGCAVSILAQVWRHGDALRRLHNLNTQIGDEGERANESGGTLNPACISIG